MENKLKFSKTLQKVFSVAEQLAKDYGSNYIGGEHIVLAMLNCPECTAYKLLVSSKAYEQQFRKCFAVSIDTRSNLKGYTPRLKNAIDDAVGFGKTVMRTEHLLLAIINSPDCIATRILVAIGADMNMLKFDTEFVVKLGVEK